jgi:hypothetical protein
VEFRQDRIMHKRCSQTAKTIKVPAIKERDLGVLPDDDHVIRNRAWVLRREDLTETRSCMPCVELCDPDTSV